MRLATFTHYAELYGANRSLLEVLWNCGHKACRSRWWWSRKRAH